MKFKNHHLKRMKQFMILIVALMFSQVVLADTTTGYADPGAAVDAVLAPLQKGFAGVQQSVDSLKGGMPDSSKNKLIQESQQTTTAVSPMNDMLSSLIQTSGKLLYYKKTDQQIRFGGKMVKVFYDLYFAAGPKKEVMFVVMQPTMSGGYHVMDTQINESAPSK